MSGKETMGVVGDVEVAEEDGVTTEESHMNMEDFDAVLDEIVDEIDAGDLMHISSSSCAPTVTKLVLCEADPVALKVVQQNIDDLLAEESGECVYTIGTSEDELPGITKEEMGTSLKTLTTICDEIGADVVQLRTSDADEGLVSDCLVRKRLLPSEFSEVRVAVVGNVDAGKSTLLGVLTHGVMDNGRGLSRKQLFRHQHEMDSGRTSSVSYDIMGFDSKGSIVNNPGHDGRLDWVQICQDAAKVLTFIDLAGHEKYLKTTVYGLTGHVPHYAMLMIGANAGIVGMTKEHLGLALALNVPVYVVVTKIDMCPENVLKENMKMLTRILKSPGCKKIPMVVETMDDVVVAASNFLSSRTCPIFKVSNVTGDNLDLVKAFLNLLKPPKVTSFDEPTEFQIDDTYSVPGVGTVVSGYMRQGVVRPNDTLLLGPDALGKFRPTVVKGIHRRRLPIEEVRAGQTASFALKKVKRAQIRKGMVLVARELEPKPTWEFEGEILVLHHPTTITTKYQAMVHCGSVRQTATIVKMDKEHIRTGDKATASFRFIRNPEYLHIGQKIVFREGRTKAIGIVTRLLE